VPQATRAISREVPSICRTTLGEVAGGSETPLEAAMERSLFAQRLINRLGTDNYGYL
jgi:hypothetical protein